MSDRVTVNFYHQDQPSHTIHMMWFDASGHVPIPGDFVITPAGSQWTVVARTWHQRPGNELHCNVVVREYVPAEGLESLTTEGTTKP